MAAVPTTLKLKRQGASPPVSHRRACALPLHVWLTLAAVCLGGGWAQAGPLDEMSLERWAKLREAERYQLNIAEKYYREKQWKVAGDEYEKFLKLHEKSEGAPYAQLKWSHCQVNQRRHNTAIKDGYQTLIDYYPDSPEAVTAALLIGRTSRDMGDLRAAKKAYDKLLKQYPKHLLAVYARVDLLEIAGKENDLARRIALLKELTYEVPRTGLAAAECVQASRQLARHSFATGEFDEGLKALATSCKEDDLAVQMIHPQIGQVAGIVGGLTAQADEKAKKLGEKLANQAIAYLRTQVTADLKDEKRRPRAVQCWYAIAELHLQARRPDKQRETFEQMLTALGPDDTLLGRLARWYKQNGKRDLARATYLKFKDPIEGQRQVAVSWVEEKQLDKAIEVYRKLALQDMANAAGWQSQIATIYRRAGKPDQAIAVYRDLLTTDAKNAGRYHWEIADTLYGAHRWKEAHTAYRGTDNFPENYKRMAYCNRQLKQFNEAISLYGQIMAGHPPSASEALLQIGYTHELAGRKEMAIKTFKQVCDRYPKSSHGSEAHSHLNSVYKIAVTLGGAKD